MRLVLHAGTHKTGTTSLQRILAANRDALRQRGYLYPLFREAKASHNPFAHELALCGPDGVGDLRRRISAGAGRDETVVVSAEELSARILGTRYWDGFDGEDYWDRRRAYLGRLRDVLGDFDEIAVHLCFRRHDDYAEALYATKVLSDQVRGSFGEFRSQCAPLFDYRAQLDAFRAVFDDVRIVSYEALRPDVVANMLDWMGLPALPDTGARANVTPDARLVYWHRRRSAGDRHRKAVLERARFVRTGGVSAGPGRSTLWASPEERQGFLARCTDPEPGFFPPASERTETVSADLGEAQMRDLDRAFKAWRRRNGRFAALFGVR